MRRGSTIATGAIMPIALVATVMPVILVLAMTAGVVADVGGRAAFGLTVMCALLAFVFVQFLRSARDLDDEDR